MTKVVIFRLEASSTLGAGHAMRCLVLAELLSKKKWKCIFSTSENSFSFLPYLRKYLRIEPCDFIKNPFSHDLHIVDHYNLDIVYETQIRPYSGKILVIDDLANREHDCDILMDQTYGREKKSYHDKVPNSCNILVGLQYALIRTDFLNLRDEALRKRKKTRKINSILANMGGADYQNYILKSLVHIQSVGFKGNVDIVFGFTAPHKELVLSYLNNVNFTYKIHMNANMPLLTLEADLAVGAAGSSVWERACLGLPSILLITAENQSFSFNKLIGDQICFQLSDLSMILSAAYEEIFVKISSICDGLGADRLLAEIEKG